MVTSWTSLPVCRNVLLESTQTCTDTATSATTHARSALDPLISNVRLATTIKMRNKTATNTKADATVTAVPLQHTIEMMSHSAEIVHKTANCVLLMCSARPAGTAVRYLTGHVSIIAHPTPTMHKILALACNVYHNLAPVVNSAIVPDVSDALCHTTGTMEAVLVCVLWVLMQLIIICASVYIVQRTVIAAPLLTHASAAGVTLK